MSNKIKDISIKMHAYYFFNDVINIKNFDSSNIKIAENSYRIILTYYIGYRTIKYSQYVKIDIVIALYLIIKKRE